MKLFTLFKSQDLEIWHAHTLLATHTRLGQIREFPLPGFDKKDTLDILLYAKLRYCSHKANTALYNCTEYGRGKKRENPRMVLLSR